MDMLSFLAGGAVVFIAELLIITLVILFIANRTFPDNKGED
ncbi:hypothetical protein [Sphingorhabdus pulchriflava]|nr:hypothetical protein [Sphingorhabdus pulchriflava]